MGELALVDRTAAAFAVMGEAGAAGQAQIIGDMPGALAVEGLALGLHMVVLDELGAGREDAGRDGLVVVGVVERDDVGAILVDDVVVLEVLVEQEQARLPVDRPAGLRGQAEFLGPLLVAADRRIDLIEIERRRIAVLQRIELPEAPGADRAQRRPVEIVVGGDRGAALQGAHLLQRIADIDRRIRLRRPAQFFHRRQRFRDFRAERAGEGGGREGLCPHFGGGRAVILLFEIAGDADGQLVAGIDQELLADAVAAGAVQLVIGAGQRYAGMAGGVIGGDGVGHPAILIGVEHRRAERDLVGDRAADDHLLLQECVVAERGFGRYFRREGGLVGGDVERAGLGIAAEQRPLRSAQDLETVDVDQILQRHARAPLIDPIEIDADHIVDAVAGRAGDADAADAERGVARIGGRIEQARGLILQVGQGDGALFRQHVAAQRLHRHRNVLEVLRAVARRHGDFLNGVAADERCVGFGVRLRFGGAAQGQPAQERDGGGLAASVESDFAHLLFPKRWICRCLGKRIPHKISQNNIKSTR